MATLVFLLGESQEQWSLVDCRLWGHRVGHDGSDLAGAAIIQGLTFCISITLTCQAQREMQGNVN